MKSINTILKNPNLLTRFRLLQLYAVDTFTKSLKDNEPSLSTLINETMLNDSLYTTDNADSLYSTESSEQVLNTLIQLKHELELYNAKLSKINRVIKLQEKYARILKSIDDSISIGTNNVDELIAKNNKLIDGINQLNVSKLNELTSVTATSTTTSIAKPTSSTSD